MLSRTAFCTIVGGLVVACSSASHAEESVTPGPSGADFRWRKAIAAPTQLEVRNRNGSIRTEPSSDDGLEVTAVKSGKPEHFAKVRIVVQEDGSTVRACALWPDQTSCDAVGPGSVRDDLDVRVDFVVRAPSTLSSVAASTLNGSITARAPSGDTRLRTMNGSIDVTAPGPVDAETMNGNLVARVGGPTSRVHLATKNGRVEVVLPPNADADVEARTLHGTISSAFGKVPAPAFPGVPNEARFRVGAGGAPVALATLNGDIVVKRGG
jgi:hypothetical protein